MAQQASGNSQDDALGLVLLGGIVLVGLVLCWMFFKVKIVYAVLKYCYWVMYPWAWLCSATGLANAFPVRWVSGLVLAATKPESVSFLGLLLSLNKASIFFYPFLVYPLINGIKAHGHVLLSLRTNHGFWSMVRRQSESFPYTIPVIRFEERWKKVPSEKIELRSRALMPDEFAAMHSLLVTKQGERQLDVGRAKEVFFNQLGRNLDVDKLLADPAYLTPHEAALFVIFAQRVGERSKASRDTASKMIHKICRSCAPDKLIVNRTAKGNQYDFSKVFDFNVGDVLLATKRPGVMQLLHEHQTVTTMLMRLLYEARKDGKLPCAHFTWLKLVDRHLWYCLQGVTPKQIARGFVEAGADNALFWNEMAASENGYKLKEKLIDNAITAFEHRLLQGRVIIKPSTYYVEDHF